MSGLNMILVNINCDFVFFPVSWFSPNENILIVIFPILAVLLSWGQFGIVSKYLFLFFVYVLMMKRLFLGGNICEIFYLTCIKKCDNVINKNIQS